MNSIPALAIAGAIAVVVFDVLIAVASRTMGVPYSYATTGSFFIYGIAAFLAGRIGTLGDAALVAGIAGLAKSTVGWSLSWMIGPGKPATGPLSRGRIAATIVMVTIIATFIGTATATVANFF